MLEKVKESKTVISRLELYTGMNKKDIEVDIQEKMRILNWMTKNNVDNIDKIGQLIADYYRGRLKLEDFK